MRRCVFPLIRLIYKKLQQNNKRNQQYMKKVFVSGCYDLLHSGHVEFFRQASQFSESPIYNKVENSLMGENKRDCLFSPIHKFLLCPSRSLGDHVMGNRWTWDEQPLLTRRAISAQTEGRNLGNATLLNAVSWLYKIAKEVLPENAFWEYLF